MVDKHRKVSVLLTELEFQKLDRLCQMNGYKKSTLIARLLREFLMKYNDLETNAVNEYAKQTQDNE